MPGYPDFRHQADADATPLFINEGVVARVGSISHGPFYVGNFETIAVVFQAALQAVQLTLLWTDLSSGGPAMGFHQSWLVTPTQAAQVRVPNMGRFVTVITDPITGAAWQQDFHAAWGTNRKGLPFLTPHNPRVQNHIANALGAGATSTQAFDGLASGPALVSMSAGVGAGSFRLDYFDESGVTRQFYRVNLAAATVDTRLIILPPSSCQSRMTNTGAGASDMALSVIAQL